MTRSVTCPLNSVPQLWRICHGLAIGCWLFSSSEWTSFLFYNDSVHDDDYVTLLKINTFRRTDNICLLTQAGNRNSSFPPIRTITTDPYSVPLFTSLRFCDVCL